MIGRLSPGSLNRADGDSLGDDDRGGVMAVGRAVGDGGSAADDRVDGGDADRAGGPDLRSLLGLAVIAARVNPVPAIGGLIVALVDQNSPMFWMPNAYVTRRRARRGFVLGSGRGLDALGQMNVEADSQVNDLAHVDIEAQLKKTVASNSRGSHGSKNKRLHGDVNECV